MTKSCEQQPLHGVRSSARLGGLVYDVVKPPGWVAPDLTDPVDVEP